MRIFQLSSWFFLNFWRPQNDLGSPTKWSHETAVNIWAKKEHRAKSYARFTKGISSYGFPRAQLQIAGLKTRKPRSQAKAPLSSSHPMDSRLVRATRIHNLLWYQLKDRNGDQRGGSEWEQIKILSQKNSAYIPIATPRVTHKQAEAHTNLSWYLRNKAWKARKQGGSKHERTWAINEEGCDPPGHPELYSAAPGHPGTSDRINLPPSGHPA
jgi:hypothetical protein